MTSAFTPRCSWVRTHLAEVGLPRLPRMLLDMFIRERQLLSEPREIQDTWYKDREQTLKRSAVPITLVSLLMAFFYLFASGWSTPLHVYFRVNNLVTLTLVFSAVWLTRRFGNSTRVRWIFRGICNVALVHYNFQAIMSYGRCFVLLSAFAPLDTKVIPADTLGAEPYGMLLSIVGTMIMGVFRVVRAQEFAIHAVTLAPMWVLQVLLLGTDLDIVSVLKVIGCYFFICIVLLFGVLQNEEEHWREFLRLQRERSEMMNIMQRAAVPVFMVSLDAASDQLCVRMWNDALATMTQQVPEGTNLEDVPGLRGSQALVLSKAIRRVLSKEVQHSPRMLLHFVAASGNVWLQCDVWPMEQSGAKAMVIGSDVTEFVEQHRSLLQDLPEEAPARDDSRDPGGLMSAELNTSTMVLQSCSPTFSVLFQRRMHGHNLLELIPSPDEQRSVREASAAVATGAGPQDLAVTFQFSPVGGPYSSRRRAQRYKPGGATRIGHLVPMCVNFRSWGEVVEGQANGLVVITVSPCETESRSDSEIAQSDPGCINQRSAEPQPRVPPRHGRSSCSDGGGRWSHEPKEAKSGQTRTRGRHARTPGTRSDSSPGQVKGFGTKMNVVIAHLIVIMRRLAYTHDDALMVLGAAMEMLVSAALADFVRATFGHGCRDWRCAYCHAFNDSCDDSCILCWRETNERLHGEREEGDSMGGAEDLQPLEVRVMRL